MDEFISEISRILNNSEDEEINSQQVIDGIESINCGQETSLMKICKGTATTKEIEEYAKSNNMDDFNIEDILMKSFKEGEDLAKNIESNILETKDCKSNEEVLIRLTEIENKLINLENHIISLRAALDPSFNKTPPPSNIQIDRSDDISSDNYSVYI